MTLFEGSIIRFVLFFRLGGIRRIRTCYHVPAFILHCTAVRTWYVSTVKKRIRSYSYRVRHVSLHHEDFPPLILSPPDVPTLRAAHLGNSIRDCRRCGPSFSLTSAAVKSVAILCRRPCCLRCSTSLLREIAYFILVY